MIEVRMEPRADGFAVTVTLPQGVSGAFEWHGKRRELAPGANSFDV
jgi:hypothetical protein